VLVGASDFDVGILIQEDGRWIKQGTFHTEIAAETLSPHAFDL